MGRRHQGLHKVGMPGCVIMVSENFQTTGCTIALRPLVRIRAAKKGAPTNAVTLPMGRTAPNKAFESTDVAERISAPASIAPGKKKR